MPNHIIQEHLDPEHYGIDEDSIVTRKHESGKLRLSSVATVNCATANTFYKISGTFTDDGDNVGFTTDDTNDRITSDVGGKKYLFMGTSDVEVSKACKLKYTLYKNGVDTGKTTPHDFKDLDDDVDSTQNISIVDIFDISPNDYFEVWVSSDQSNTTVTVNTLTIIFRW